LTVGASLLAMAVHQAIFVCLTDRYRQQAGSYSFFGVFRITLWQYAGPPADTAQTSPGNCE
jgi:hypothetical protein